jgi:hypothetical protein
MHTKLFLIGVFLLLTSCTKTDINKAHNCSIYTFGNTTINETAFKQMCNEANRSIFLTTGVAAYQNFSDCINKFNKTTLMVTCKTWE